MTHLPDPIRQPQFYADVPGKRLMAWFIDAGFIAIIVVILGVFTLTLAFWLLPFTVFMVSLFYRTITIASASATIGMRIAAIELRNARGERLSFGEALLHTLGYLFTVSTAVAQLISILFMSASERGQGLSDMVLGTTMLNRRAN